MKQSLMIFLLGTLTFSSVYAQGKKWVYFTDKTGTQLLDSVSSVLNRDQPVYRPYQEYLIAQGCEIMNTSKWLNAVSVKGCNTWQESSEFPPFILAVQRVQSISSRSISTDIPKLSSALRQIHGEEIIKAGLTGQQVKIGILDAGFLDADRELSLDDIFYEDRFIKYQNFTHDGQESFGGDKKYNEDHGTQVWENIGGYDRDKNTHLGLATGAEYYLAKTDRNDQEVKGEEDYWITALEWMHKEGIMLVNSSVGYSDQFDDPTENYTPGQMDGKSAAITQAANIAANEKGMLLVVSGGNKGNTDFQVIQAPSDAKNVLTVGACRAKNHEKLSFSSMGPPFLHYPKPDVCVFHLGGTSFSTAVITGLAACILEARPNSTNTDVMDIIKKSSHLYPYPNNYVGYGVPDARKVLQLLENPNQHVWQSHEVSVSSSTFELQNITSSEIVIYHKSGPFTVVEEKVIEVSGNKRLIQRPSGTARTTIYYNEEVLELLWK